MFLSTISFVDECPTYVAENSSNSFLNIKPRSPAPSTTGMISHFHLVIPTKAATLMAAANRSMVFAGGILTISRGTGANLAHSCSRSN